MELRLIQSEDVPEVVGLVREVLTEFGLRFGEGSETDAEVLRLPESYLGGAFWIARSNNVLIGCCGIFPVAEGTYELRKMYLRPTSRGLGLGKRFLDAAVAWARARGAERLGLDTAEQMTRAIAFYESNGFIRDDRWLKGARCSRGYVLTLGT